MTDVDLLALAQRVASAARDAEQVEAFVLRSRDVDVKVFDGEVESLVVAQLEGVGVRVVDGGRQGYAWSGSLDPAVVDETVADARDNAGFGAPDPTAGLASPADFAGVHEVDVDLWRDDVLAVDTARKVALALELDAAVRAWDPRIRGVESSSYGDAAIETAVANSLGIAAASRRTTCSISSYAMAGEGSETRTGSGFSAARSFSDLDVEEAARDAAERALRLLGARPISSRRLPVVLDPLVTRSLLGLVGSALGGEAITKGRSLFVGREGEEVAASHVTLLDDPTNPDAFGAAARDAEGVPTRRVELVRDGRLVAFLHNVYTARKAAAVTTGSAVRGGFKSAPGVGARALTVVPGTRSPQEIMASVPEALYVQTVSGIHSGTNIVSGDFSVGADGLMVRGGELAEPVREVTIASTLQRILTDVVEIGNDLRWLPGGGAGMTLLVGDMSVAGS